MEELNDICSNSEEKYDINKYDMYVYLDKKFFNSEHTSNIQKDMFDCVTYVNHTLGNNLMDIVYEISMQSDQYFFLDISDATLFLHEMLSPMTKLA